MDPTLGVERLENHLFVAEKRCFTSEGSIVDLKSRGKRNRQRQKEEEWRIGSYTLKGVKSPFIVYLYNVLAVFRRSGEVGERYVHCEEADTFDAIISYSMQQSKSSMP